MVNLNLEKEFANALKDLGYELSDLYKEEKEQGLGMSGLGRLGVCMLEGLTTKNVPAVGYGVRYDIGSFNQKLDANGTQIEVPDFWNN